MIVRKFGASWAAGTELGILKSEDDTSIQRPPVVQAVGGSEGAFDVWGDDNSPWGPATVTKKVTVSGASYSAAETALEALITATIAAGRNKLWSILRDGTTHRWAWAKCTGFSRLEQSKAAALAMETQLSFLLPEGVWYAESQSTANRTGAGTVSCTNSGNTRALVRAVVAAGAVNPGLAIGAGPPIWAWTGTASGTGLVVDAAAAVCTNNGANAYSSLSYGPGGSGQVEFFWLPPGANTVTVTMTGSYQVTLTWWNTYL